MSSSNPVLLPLPEAGRALHWRVAMAIWREYENRPGYAQGPMNGLLAAELAVAAIRAMREPDPRMVAAALPLIAEPTEAQRAIGEAALALLPPVRVEQHFMGQQAASDLVRDWQTMIDAASVDRNPKGEKPQALSAEHESAVVSEASETPIPNHSSETPVE